MDRPTVCQIYNQLIFEVDLHSGPKINDKLENKVSMLSARVNNYTGNVLIDSGGHFNQIPLLHINKAIIKTAIGELQKVNRQAYTTFIARHGGRNAYIVKNLIHDIIVGTYTLTKINPLLIFKIIKL